MGSEPDQQFKMVTVFTIFYQLLSSVSLVESIIRISTSSLGPIRTEPHGRQFQTSTRCSYA